MIQCEHDNGARRLYERAATAITEYNKELEAIAVISGHAKAKDAESDELTEIEYECLSCLLVNAFLMTLPEQ